MERIDLELIHCLSFIASALISTEVGIDHVYKPCYLAPGLVVAVVVLGLLNSLKANSIHMEQPNSSYIGSPLHIQVIPN